MGAFSSRLDAKHSPFSQMRNARLGTAFGGRSVGRKRTPMPVSTATAP